MKHLLSVTLLGVFTLGGCASSSNLYHWGGYENQVYQMYIKPEKVTPEKQAATLGKDLEKAKSQNKSVPPGFYAHLGYQYYQMGNTQKAQQFFVLEKDKFPESTTYVNLMLQKLK